MESCVYEGRVRHVRANPVRHGFSYRVCYLYLDLAELSTVFRGRWFWSARRRALARFRRSDHFGPQDVPLETCVRDLVEERTGRRPRGPVRLLTHLAYFGYCFNPVSFYYCFRPETGDLETIVAEVNNTPWGERTCYVLPVEHGQEAGPFRFTPDKVMHVSPFMEMDVRYDWRFSAPGARLSVNMANLKDEEQIFAASMSLNRREINSRALAGVLIRYPLMTAKVTAAIYWQALKLFVKRCPFYPHPSRRSSLAGRT